FIHNLREYGVAFDATYRKLGRAFERIVSEDVSTSFGAELEVFAEKRFGDSFTLRAVGSHLLTSRQLDVFDKCDAIADQLARDFDEYELEAEKAGPVFQLVGRYAF